MSRNATDMNSSEAFGKTNFFYTVCTQERDVNAMYEKNMSNSGLTWRRSDRRDTRTIIVVRFNQEHNEERLTLELVFL